MRNSLFRMILGGFATAVALTLGNVISESPSEPVAKASALVPVSIESDSEWG